MITNPMSQGSRGVRQAWMLGAGALAAMAVSSAGMASAAPITWGTPTTIAGPTDVNTTGTSVFAWDPGISGSGNYDLASSGYGAINPVINGVTFSGSLPTGSSISFNGTTPTGAPAGHMYADTGPFTGIFSTAYPTLNFGTSLSSSGAYPILMYQLANASPPSHIGTPAYNYALALTDYTTYVPGFPPSGSLTGDTITMKLGNLTPGHQYQLQIWEANTWGFDQTISDSAANFGGPGSIEFSAGGHSSTLNSGGGYMGAYVLGTFVAGSAGYQTLAMEAGPTSTNHDILINMMQLRDLGVAPTVPEPTALTLLACAGAGALLLGRRRKPSVGILGRGAGG